MNYQDEEWLEEQYHVKGLTQAEIAEKCSVNRTTIIRWMKRHEIESRGPGYSQAEGRYKDEDWLREARNRDEEVEEMADKFLERLLKNRVYLDDPSDAPDGALVRQGRSGRWYYDTSETQRRSPTRIYVSSPEKAPDSVTVRGGKNGGYFYYRNESPRGQY